MQINEFIAELTEEIAGHHKTFPPLDSEELKKWNSRFSRSSLPEDFLDLLKRTNGIHFWVSEGSPQGYFRLLPLREIDNARQVMWGGSLNDSDAGAIPNTNWLAISGHQDGACYIVLDPDMSRYYLMDSCGADLTCPVGNNVQELLDYVWEHWIKALDSNNK
jgi:hypothetical protein